MTTKPKTVTQHLSDGRSPALCSCGLWVANHPQPQPEATEPQSNTDTAKTYPTVSQSHDKLDELKQVVIDVCQPCLDGEKGECHTPGCIQWLRGDIENQMGERLDFEHRYEYLDQHTAARVAEARIDEVERIDPTGGRHYKARRLAELTNKKEAEGQNE